MAPRGNNSLNVITRKFIEWIIRGDTVNLNEAAAILRVSKRRLYDVVNVLEGIGVLEKCGMNQVRWSDLRDRTRSSDLYSQCANLRQLEVEIDMSVRGLVSALKCVEMDTAASQYAYVRLEDLRSSQMFTDKTLIVVKSSTQRDIKTSLSQPMNSLLSQVKFESSGRTTLQGFISPAGSYVHSDFEQHLFGNGCPNFLTDKALSTPGIDVVIKQESCHSEDWKKSGNAGQNKQCNELLDVSQDVVNGEPDKCSSSIANGVCLTGDELPKNEIMGNNDTMPKSEFSVTNRAWFITTAMEEHTDPVSNERQNSSLLCDNSLCSTSPTMGICDALTSSEWETWTCTSDSM